MDILVELFGAIGLGMLLVGFAINHKDTCKAKIIYNLLNIVGALILTIYAIIMNSWIFILLEGIWAIFSLVFIYDFYKKGCWKKSGLIKKKKN